VAVYKHCHRFPVVGGDGGGSSVGDGGDIGVGGQQFGSFSGGNARERMNFSRRPIVLSRWLDYSCLLLHYILYIV